jgi:hypothetical protein
VEPIAQENYPLRYSTREALAALPWFDVDHGELRLVDEGIGPIIDVHTHYSLPAVRSAVDLHAATPDSNLLLGRCCSHHLDVYANQNFNPAELRALKRELVLGGLWGRGSRIDHTVVNMARDMQSMGITHQVVLGIDMPLPTRHVAMTLDTVKERGDATGFGSIYPRRRKRRQHFEEQLHRGSLGVKIHPPNMLLRPDDPRAMEIYGWCGAANIPVFWHCGPAGIEPKRGQECGQVRHYERPLVEHPKTTFILGHSGATQHREAIDLARRYANAYLDVSCISLGQLREVIAAVDHDRLMFGSDWPFYHPILPLAKVLIATEEQPALRRKILHDNAARLLERIGPG